MKSGLRLEPVLFMLLLAPWAAGQSTGASSSAQTGVSSFGSDQPSSARNPADDITAVAPPFNVEDVIRMHHAGIQDEVLLNLLRARYHPLKLSQDDRARLISNSVSDAVIRAMEFPMGTPANEPTQSAQVHIPPPAPAARPGDGVRPPAAPPMAAAAPPASVSLPSPSVATLRIPLPNPTRETVVAGPSASESESAPEPTQPGVYFRAGAFWEPLDIESIFWRHNSNSPTRNIHGYVSGPISTLAADSDGDFLVITPDSVSVMGYQLVRMHNDKRGRYFRPAANSGGNGPSVASGDNVSYNPERLGPTRWLISPRDLPKGEYGFLPPPLSDVRSVTGYSTTLFTFRME